MRSDIEFNAEGVTLRGWFYSAAGTSDMPAPTVVMAHGFAAVKEMYLSDYAEVFSAGGFNVLVFDHRNFGASEGVPRQEIDPWAQLRDYRHAISYACTRDDVDANRIGIWGSSYSGGHVLVVAAIDRRVRCVVSQVPLISGGRNIQRLVRADLIGGYRAQFDTDRMARFHGASPAMVPVVCEDPLGVAVLPTADSWAWFEGARQTRAPNFRNEVTLRSVEMLMEYEPGVYINRIAPTPLLMVVGTDDVVAVTDEALSAYERALAPKSIKLLPGGHFSAYVEHFAQSSRAACDWLQQHLLPSAK